MGIPLYNGQIVGQGLARLTSAFITKPNVRAWLAAVLQPMQALEDATWQVLTSRFLATATVYALPQTNSVFDSLGALVGQARDGLSDSDYKSLIYLRVAVNRSTGRMGDWAKFAATLLQTSGGPCVYYEGPPAPYGLPVVPLNPGDASLALTMLDMTVSPALVAGILGGGVPNGVRGTLVYTTWPHVAGPTGDLVCGSVYDSTAGNGCLGSVYSAAAGGSVASSLAMN